MLLKVGSSGEVVKQVQKFLGLTADGIFGKGTEQSVKDFQKLNGLTPDGLVGSGTLAKMGIKVEAASAPTPNNAPSAGASTQRIKLRL